MRHLKAHRKLGRTTEHRLSLLRNLATSLINARNERVVTTLPKAKELRPFIERVITLSRKAQTLEGDDAAVQAVHLRRQAATFFHAGNRQQKIATGRRQQKNEEGKRFPAVPARTAGVAAVKRLFDELGERYKDRPGGYTRIIKLGRRDGDNAELAIIELVGSPRELEAAKQTEKRAKSVTSDKRKSARASKSGEAEGGRRGGHKADKTFEKEETTAARGSRSKTGGEDVKDADKAGSGGRRSKKTESTAAEQDTDK
ncbi:MAG TPA: 50S ribosomal protein L17 [Pyrinomonadaceae bacterium]|nr:50S ribosomal protein L17 [Pyrinomonadaceae bacterium]